MKDMKKSLEKLAGDLSRVAEQVEKLAGELAPKPATKPVKKTVAKKASKKPAQPTAVDTVYKAIARLKKGADMAKLKQKTGFDNKKIHNLVYKLKKQGMIKSLGKGIYVKA